MSSLVGGTANDTLDVCGSFLLLKDSSISKGSSSPVLDLLSPLTVEGRMKLGSSIVVVVVINKGIGIWVSVCFFMVCGSHTMAMN